MAGAVVSLTYQAQVDDLRKKLASIPDITAAEARKAVREMDKAIRAATKAASSAGDAGKASAKAAAAAAAEVREGLKGLGEVAGLPVEQVEKLGKGLAVLASPAGAAAAAVGGITLALGAAAVGAVKLVQAAAGMGPALEPFRELAGFGGLDSAALSSLAAAAAAMAAVETVGRRVVEVLGADLAPVVERVALVVVKMGLALVDAANTAAEGQGIFRTLADDLATLALRGMFPIITIVEGMAGAFASLAEAVGQNGLAQRFYAASRAVGEFADKAGKGLADSVLGELDTQIRRVDESFGDYDAQARALIGVQAGLATATKAGIDATKGAAKATDEAAAAAKRAAAEYRAAEAARKGQLGVEALALRTIEEQARLSGSEADQIAAIDARAAAEKAAVDQQVADLTRLGQGEEARALAEIRYAQIRTDKEKQLQALQAAGAKAAEDQAAAARSRAFAVAGEVTAVASAATSALSSVGALAAAQSAREIEAVRTSREQLGEDITRAEEEQLARREAAAKKAARRAFAIQQAAALATAAVQGAQAVISALATLGPVAGPIAAGLLTASIAAQVALIASTPPPKFAAGGIVEPQSYDGRLIEAEPGEGVLTRRGVRAVGGEEGVAAANRGEGPGGAPGVMLVALPSMSRYLAVEAARPSAFGKAVQGRVRATGRR